MIPIRGFPFMPPVMVAELVYVVLVSIMCFLLYNKTREAYDLTKHKGIYFFRNAFLFFGFAFMARFAFVATLTLRKTFQLGFPHIAKAFSLPLMSFFATLSMFYLLLGVFSKKMKNEFWHRSSILFTLVLTIVVYLTRNPFLIVIIHTIIFMVILTLSTIDVIKNRKNKSKAKKVRAHILYFMIYLFWVLNIFVVIAFRRFHNVYVGIGLYSLSTLLFYYIFRRATKRLGV